MGLGAPHSNSPIANGNARIIIPAEYLTERVDIKIIIQFAMSFFHPRSNLSPSEGLKGLEAG